MSFASSEPAPPLQRGTSTALWRQIQATLEQELHTGSFTPGERLPTEKELAKRFGVNRHTVRQAMAALVRKDLIVVEQGRGAFVRKDMLDYTLARRVRFRENILRESRVPSEELLGDDITPAEQKSAAALRVPVGTPLVRLRTLCRADELPLCYSTMFLPKARFADFAAIYRKHGSITASFTALGIPDFIRTQTRIMARQPDGAEARALHINRHTPVLMVESVNADTDDIPIEYSVSIWAADRVQFVIDAPPACTAPPSSGCCP